MRVPPAMLLALALPSLGAASSSPSYVLQQVTLDGGGGVSTASSTYRMEDSLGQEAVIGCSASPHFVLQSGFWSHLGTGLVPVVLTVSRNPGNPALPDLAWTGNNPPYAVYRATSPAAVYTSLDHMQSAKSWTDPAPPAAPVVYYAILPTAAGPLRDPGRGQPAGPRRQRAVQVGLRRP